MKAMIAFLKAKREPHIVIIDDITRLARSMSTHLMLREKIKNAGGILQSPSLEFGDDSDSQLVEHLRHADVAGVEDEIGVGQLQGQDVRDALPPARGVRVGDDDHLHGRSSVWVLVGTCPR